MRLSDIMSAIQLSDFPVAALVIFLGVFVVMATRALRMPPSQRQHAASLPLADDRAAVSR